MSSSEAKMEEQPIEELNDMNDTLEMEKLRETFRKRVRDAFNLFDRKSDDSCDEREVGTILRALGLAPYEAEILGIVQKIRMDEPSSFVLYSRLEPVILDCMIQHHLRKTYALLPVYKLLKAFKTLDTERRGYLTGEELTDMLTKEAVPGVQENEPLEPLRQEEIQDFLDFGLDSDDELFYYEDYCFKIKTLIEQQFGD
ncbi:hypothetical protein PCE1_002281 [Barthelona sp. PCE]